MKNTVVIFFLLFFNHAIAQHVITVQTGVDVKQYSTLDSAMLFAQSGDQVFIPGGNYSIQNFIINKSVMIFGSGHYPDSTTATGRTVISGNLILTNGSSGGMIMGCTVTDSVIIGTGIAGTDSVANYSILRCNINHLYFSSTGTTTNARNISVSENVIRGNIMGANAQNLNFSKNIIEKRISYFDNADFTNNDFIGLGNCTNFINQMEHVVGCSFSNNIFLYAPPACPAGMFLDSTCANNTFLNNLFRQTIVFPVGTNSGMSNIISQPVASIFTSATGGTFDYSSDYTLRITSPGVHAGNDGYDVGIYGSIQPYKTAAVPFNPHIQMKSVGTVTDPQGQLNIQIKVSAQDN